MCVAESFLRGYSYFSALHDGRVDQVFTQEPTHLLQELRLPSGSSDVRQAMRS